MGCIIVIWIFAFVVVFFLTGNAMVLEGRIFPGGDLENSMVAIVFVIIVLIVDSLLIFKLGQKISTKIPQNKFLKVLPKIISISIICIIFGGFSYKMLPKCDFCDNISTKTAYDNQLCKTCYNEIEEKIKNAESVADSFDYDDYTIPVSDYRRTVGMNGTIRYYCTRNCGEGCLKDGRNCTRGYNDTKCKFDYSLSKGCIDSGWSGCPCCDSITYEEWYDWYDKALSRRY